MDELGVEVAELHEIRTSFFVVGIGQSATPSTFFVETRIFLEYTV
jgi:hypothetical protein